MANDLTKERIEQLAPDQASLGAALKLMKPSGWPLLARAADGSLIWGECQGSGAAPYRVVVSPGDIGYKCTCPSRKFPCKHVLAVMWMASEHPERLEQAAPPAWVADWLERRRPKARAPRPAAGASPAVPTGGSMAAALAEADDDAPADPKALARAEAQRLRLREDREASVLDGLAELDRWILDQLNLGLAGFSQRAMTSAKTLSTRLVDAKAPGLAGRLDALGADVFRVPEPMRDDLVLEQLAALVLISSAYRNQEKLPAGLVDDVRRTVGWSLRREELLADATAPRISAGWIVAATRTIVQADKLRRLETWLINATTPAPAARIALLLDFVPVSTAATASAFIAGEMFSAELVFYPSATPLRAQLASRSASAPLAWPDLPDGLDAALGAYEAALAAQPWIDSWPLAARGLAVEQIEPGRLGLGDGSGLALPLDRQQTDRLLPMLGLAPISALCVWDGRVATLLAADTPVGAWYEDG